MGAVLNMRPDLFNAALAGVPFVDCLTTMLGERARRVAACCMHTSSVHACMQSPAPCCCRSLPPGCLRAPLPDDSIPLTIIEKEEWGDPAQPEYYGYMRSYSPVDNVAPQP